MTRVKLDVLKPWIGQRVANFLNGLEDDVIVEFVFNQLEDKVSVMTFEDGVLRPKFKLIVKVEILLESK